MLNHHLNACANINRFISSKNFLKPWKQANITEAKFIELADTGDILLYRGNSFGSKVIRAATHGKYDHVGMILKFGDDLERIFIIEASSNLGVHLSDWSFIR